MNLKSDEAINLKRYKYRKMNSSPVMKTSPFYFDEFVEMKDGVLLGLKENTQEDRTDEDALYYMFVDINGRAKPNRFGLDIFIVNIYEDRIGAMGDNAAHSLLKADCSPIGRGLYCSQYYLLGGRF